MAGTCCGQNVRFSMARMCHGAKFQIQQRRTVWLSKKMVNSACLVCVVVKNVEFSMAGMCCGKNVSFNTVGMCLVEIMSQSA
jgi:hypothetical protein